MSPLDTIIYICYPEFDWLRECWAFLVVMDSPAPVPAGD